MASLSSACRLTVRLSAKKLPTNNTFRGLQTSAVNLAAQKLSMPALSPTMTEGNIGKWKVKEGDSFAAGDVLLQIETDKASMDVEAQDDGIMAKIIIGDDCKGIKVGTRIGILAEVGDDLSKLDLSDKDPIIANSSREGSSDPKLETTHHDKDAVGSSELKVTSQQGSTFDSELKKTRTLLPSVQHLMHIHNLDRATIDKITPSGPSNRLLKGDVLAFLGQVSKSYPLQLSSKISNLSHLDLSNIKAMAPTPKIMKSEKSQVVEPEVTVILEQSISFENIHDIQKKMESNLGVTLSEDKFISRATEEANKTLPRPKSFQVTQNELFDIVLGLKPNSRHSKPFTSYKFSPNLADPLLVSSSFGSKHENSRRIDVIDILSGKKTTSLNSYVTKNKTLNLESKQRLFKLEVTKDNVERGKMFLSTMKTTLESNPGSLIF